MIKKEKNVKIPNTLIEESAMIDDEATLKLKSKQKDIPSNNTSVLPISSN